MTTFVCINCDSYNKYSKTNVITLSFSNDINKFFY
jgi:hypothetical protein